MSVVSSKYRGEPESKKSNVNNVLDWLSIVTILSTKRNTYILKCFLQFGCTNLDGSQKEGGNFLNFLWKDGGSNPGGTMVNHVLKIISISHCLDISYVFLYIIVRPFIFIDAIKTVMLFITYTLCNNVLFIFNLEKVQSYRHNNSFQAGKVNAKFWQL